MNRRGPAGDDDDDRQFVTALARGLALLRAFRVGDRPLTNLELARRTGLPKPTISRLAMTLTQLGYLSYDPVSGCYELGGGTLALGRVAMSSMDIVQKAQPIMERLAGEILMNVGLGVREQLEMVYVEACQSPSRIALRLDVGSRLPLATSAMGRAYLAALDPNDRRQLIGKLKRQTKSEAPIPEAGITDAIAEYQAQGYCTSLGDWHGDIHGVAAPLPFIHAQEQFVLNCGGPAYLMSKDMLKERLGPALLRAVSEITEVMGYPAPVRTTLIEQPFQRRKRRVSTAG